MLTPRGHSRFGVARGREGNGSNQSPALPESSLDPIPADAKVAVAPKPVGVNAATLTGLDDLNALSREIKRSNSEKKPKTRESADRANLGLLEIPASRLVVEKRLLDIEAQAILAKGLQTGGFIADNRPKLAIDVVASVGEVNGAEPVTLVELDS